MKIELLVTPDCAPCEKAEALWREVSAKQGLPLTVLSIRQRAGKYLAHRFRLNTFPAVVIDDRLVAVGVQSYEEAERLLSSAVAKLVAGKVT